MSVSVTIQTQGETVKALDNITKVFDRNRNWVINEAIKNYLDLHQWQIDQVRQGFADAPTGHTLSHEEASNRIMKRHARASKLRK